MLADMNRLNEATKAAEEIKSIVAKEMNKKLIRDYYHILGRIELKRNNYALAIEHLQKTLDLYPYVQGGIWELMFTGPLAKAYYESGDLDKALSTYEKLSAMVWSNYFTGDINVENFYMLGKIWEQKGDTTKAIENYEKFLDLWKDADSGIAEVEDARKRLDGLRDN
jgi:tetratricopeptide (TPR) repeat protein